jgi:hypothetical protein
MYTESPQYHPSGVSHCHWIQRYKGGQTFPGSGLERDICSLTFETCASQCLIGVKRDFLEFNPDVAKHSVVNGIAESLAIQREDVVSTPLLVMMGQR